MVNTAPSSSSWWKTAPLPDPPLRWEYRLLLVLFALSMGELLVLPPSIHGDGVGYFAYLRSLLFDGNLDFRNEFLHFGQHTTLQMLDPGPTRTGLVYNVWSVGPALLWSPFYLVGHALALLLSSLGWQGAVDGYSAPYVYAVAVGSAIYGFAGLVITYRLCRSRFPLVPSLMALATVWSATSLPAYMYFHPSLSHSGSFFLVAAFFSLWWSHRGSSSQRCWLGLGLLIGLMAAVRPQNVLFLVPVAIHELHLLRIGTSELWLVGSLRWIRRWVALGVGAVVAFSPQMVAWWVLYGRIITNPYSEYSESVGFDWLHPRLWDVLFSSKHGMVSWTPAVGVALLGLTLASARRDSLARVLGSAFLVQFYLVSAFSNWWQGASFGGRMFIELTPAFVVGLATLFAGLGHRVRRAAIAGILALSLWNGLLMVQYGTGALPLEDYVDWGVLVRGQLSVAPEMLLALASRHGLGRYAFAIAGVAVVTAIAVATWAGRGSGSRGQEDESHP